MVSIMSNELRMSDVFELPVVERNDSIFHNKTSGGIVFEFEIQIGGHSAKHVEHAINNHDSMQDQITQLEKELAELRPIAAQAKQWRDEHLRTVKVNDQLGKDKAEFVEALRKIDKCGVMAGKAMKQYAKEILERMK